MPNANDEKNDAGARGQGAPPGLAPALKWLAGSAGLTGAFYASGFVIEKSYQKLLGVEIIDPANAIYLRSASDFWFAVANTSLSFADELADRFRSPSARHLATLLPPRPGAPAATPWLAGWLFLATLAVLGLLGAAALRRRPGARARLLAVKGRLGRALSGLAVPSAPRRRALVVLGLAVASIGYFDLPALHMSKFLLKGSEAYLHSRNHSLLRDHIYAFEHTFWCAHVSAPGCAGPPDAIQSRLDSMFLLHFVITSALIVACVRISARGAGLPLDIVLGTMALIMAVGLLAFYGVTERSFAESKLVVVHYQKEDWLEGTLLSQDAKQLLLLPKNEARPIEVPADKPGLIKIVGQVPVLELQDSHQQTVRAVKLAEKDTVVTAFCLQSNRQCSFLAGAWQKGKPVAELPSVEIEYSGQITSRLLHGFVVADTDSCLYLFDQVTHEIWELTRSRVTLVEVEGLADVFQGAPRAGVKLTPPPPLPTEGGRS
jgi:hypothetical protein